ncbi:MAG: protein-L-isoaspartate O-methyltransferase, partial [Waddliaceae bacterium]
AKEAEERFAKLGYDNIYVKIDDGTLGWSEKAPFDAILVTAGSPALPESLLNQLKPGGRLVIPIGDLFGQELICVRKNSEGKYFRKFLGPVRFVPLIGEEGWRD